MIKKKDGIILRQIHGISYLIDTKCNYYDDKCYLYELNEVGAFLWKNIDEFNTVKKLAHYLFEQIIDDIEEELILKDVIEYIDILKSNGFIE